MATNYRISECAASLIEAMQHLHSFYEAFHTAAEAGGAGPVPLDEFENAWNELDNKAGILVGQQIIRDNLLSL